MKFNYRKITHETIEITGVSTSEKNIIIPSEIDGFSVTHIGDWAFENNVDIIHSNHKIKMVDGIATIIRSKKKRDEFTIFQGSIFNTKEKCFVANRGKFFAHGDNLKQAIEDVNFKFLQENFDLDKIVKEIKAKQTISVSEFRLITGACKFGCESFMNQKGLTETEYPLNKALELLNGQFGWEKLSKQFE